MLRFIDGKYFQGNGPRAGSQTIVVASESGSLAENSAQAWDSVLSMK